MAARFDTISHSIRGLDELLGMPRATQVDPAGWRAILPRLRTSPAFNIDRLPDDVAAIHVGYFRFRYESQARAGRPMEGWCSLSSSTILDPHI